MIKKQFERSELANFISRFEALPLARIWFGDYLALYLELGMQIGNYSGSRRSKHERHIFAGCDWTLTDSNGVTFKRSELTEARVLQILGGSNVLSVKIDSCNELLVAFDNQCLIHTHSADQTDWVLFESPDKNVFIENGCPVMETETRR